MTLNARAKGASFELATIKKFKDRGWIEACSSRSESKRLDDKGVDVCYTDPLSVQCKAVEKMGPMHDVLARMPKGLNVVFHKRNRKGIVVSMEEETFWHLIDELIKAGVINPE